jgi:hypothetical protein
VGWVDGVAWDWSLGRGHLESVFVNIPRVF